MEWLNLLFDPLFRVPLAAGLLLALALPPIGALLRLRDEWLAALGLAHVSAAGTLAGLAFHLPGLAGGALAGGAAATLKALAGARGNDAYGVMILLGWGATLLVAANTAPGEAVAHALADGQLYFAGTGHLVAAGLYGVGVALALPWLSRRLIRARFMPDDERANRMPAWRWHLGFDLLVALGMAVGTATIGLMAGFALVFLPAWAAFRIAPGWIWALVLSSLIGTLAYLGAFVAAMGFDQPFGPVMVAALLTVCPAIALLGSAGKTAG